MDITVQRILWLLLTGVVVACIIALIMRRALGSFVRKLLESGADAPENAVSLSDLGVKETGYLRSCLEGRLRDGGNARALLHIREKRPAREKQIQEGILLFASDHRVRSPAGRSGRRRLLSVAGADRTVVRFVPGRLIHPESFL